MVRCETCWFLIVLIESMFLKPIFQDSNGFAVKFFVQKDLSQEIQAELCETITVREILILLYS
jgi:hypothetical protein